MVPVYLFLGFLESGKTSFIQETLTDPEFNTGKSILLLVCEEGLQAYDVSQFSAQNVHIVTYENESQLTAENLLNESRAVAAECVLIEYNGMWNTQSLADAFPKQWRLFQTIMTIDSTSFQPFLKNMRSLMLDKVQLSEMVVFNRCTTDTDRAFLHRSIRILNRHAQMMFEFTDGSVAQDDILDELPYDTTNNEITIADTDFGIFYLDASENPEKYNHKTLHFKAMVCITPKVAKTQFVPGRFCMTCCEDDITFVGLICDANGHTMPEHRSWVDITCTVSLKEHDIYEGKGPWLTLTNITYDAPAPKEELVYLA